MFICDAEQPLPSNLLAAVGGAVSGGAEVLAPACVGIGAQVAAASVARTRIGIEVEEVSPVVVESAFMVAWRFAKIQAGAPCSVSTMLAVTADVVRRGSPRLCLICDAEQRAVKFVGAVGRRGVRRSGSSGTVRGLSRRSSSRGVGARTRYGIGCGKRSGPCRGRWCQSGERFDRNSSHPAPWQRSHPVPGDADVVRRSGPRRVYLRC